MFEARYEIADDDGVFRLDRDQLGLMLGEILKVDFIHHIDATAQGPLVIVRRALTDTDQADPVLSILARYGIVAPLGDIRSVLHHQCRPRVQAFLSKELSCLRPDSDMASAEFSWLPPLPVAITTPR
jgi:hypothetical protein